MKNIAEAAGQIAREAGMLVADYARKSDLLINEKGSSFDFVTEADLASQMLIKKRIAELFPGDRVIGEEDGLTDCEVIKTLNACGKSERVWVVDPLDGTVNYIHGILGYGVSIGVVSGGEPVVGAVYQPEVNLLYLAEKGAGAYRYRCRDAAGQNVNNGNTDTDTEQDIAAQNFVNGMKLHCSARNRLIDALTAASVPVSDMDWRRHTNLWCEKAAMECLNMRMLGSSVYEQTRVAEGGLDFYFELGPHPWDLTASYCIVTEAGGIETRLDGGKFDYGIGGVIAASGAIHEAAVKLIRESDPGLQDLLFRYRER